MAKKDLANVTADLSALASMMPTQRTVVAPPVEPPVLKVVVAPAVAKAKDESLTQFSLSLRKDLRKQLSRLAADADMTMRAFVLNALKEKGLFVGDDDIADLRKERH